MSPKFLSKLAMLTAFIFEFAGIIMDWRTSPLGQNNCYSNNDTPNPYISARQLYALGVLILLAKLVYAFKSKNYRRSFSLVFIILLFVAIAFAVQWGSAFCHS
jgi:predicted ferric reductase